MPVHLQRAIVMESDALSQPGEMQSVIERGALPGLQVKTSFWCVNARVSPSGPTAT